MEKCHIKIVKFEVKNRKLKICAQILELIKTRVNKNKNNYVGISPTETAFLKFMK